MNVHTYMHTMHCMYYITICCIVRYRWCRIVLLKSDLLYYSYYLFDFGDCTLVFLLQSKQIVLFVILHTEHSLSSDICVLFSSR